jgi:hypothetical protein
VITAVRAIYTSPDGPRPVRADDALTGQQQVGAAALPARAALLGQGDILSQIVGGQPLAVFGYEEHEGLASQPHLRAPPKRAGVQDAPPLK